MHLSPPTVVTVHPSHGPPQRVARAPSFGQPISCVSDRGRWRCWGLSALALWSILTHPGGGAGQSLTPLSPCHCRHPSSGDRSAVNSICIITCPVFSPSLFSFSVVVVLLLLCCCSCCSSSSLPSLLLLFFFSFFVVVNVFLVIILFLHHRCRRRRCCCCCSSSSQFFFIVVLCCCCPYSSHSSS